jgi:hypothetical protein
LTYSAGIDNKAVENQIQAVSAGPKTISLQGAVSNVAIVQSLLGTCKLLQIKPDQWFKEVLQSIQLYKTASLNLLLINRKVAKENSRSQQVRYV